MIPKGYYLWVVLLLIMLGAGVYFAYTKMQSSANMTPDPKAIPSNKPQPYISVEAFLQAVDDCKVQRIILRGPSASSASIVMTDGSYAAIKSVSETQIRTSVSQNVTKCGSVTIELVPSPLQ